MPFLVFFYLPRCIVNSHGNIFPYPTSKIVRLWSGSQNFLSWIFEKVVDKGPFTGFSPKHRGIEGLQHPIKTTTKHSWLLWHFTTWLSRAAEGEQKCAKVFSNGRVEGSFPCCYYLMSFRYRTFQVFTVGIPEGRSSRGAVRSRDEAFTIVSWTKH